MNELEKLGLVVMGFSLFLSVHANLLTRLFCVFLLGLGGFLFITGERIKAWLIRHYPEVPW